MVLPPALIWGELSKDKVSKTEASIICTAKTNVFPFCVFSLYRVQGKGDAQIREVSETLEPATLGTNRRMTVPSMQKMGTSINNSKGPLKTSISSFLAYFP